MGKQISITLPETIELLKCQLTSGNRDGERLLGLRYTLPDDTEVILGLTIDEALQLSEALKHCANRLIAEDN